MADAQDQLAALGRLEAATEAGLMPYSGLLHVWVNQAIDEVDRQELEAALAAYPLLWWAQVAA